MAQPKTARLITEAAQDTRITPLEAAKVTIDNTVGRVAYAWDAGNTRKQLIYGNTGYRVINNLLPTLTSGTIAIIRENNTVTINFVDAIFNNPATGLLALEGIMPTGFQNYYWTDSLLGGGQRVRAVVTAVRIYNHTPATIYNGDIKFTTINPWPTTLPGTAVGSITA